MDNNLYYIAINRLSGLSVEMNAIANNIANINTVGFRREGVSFSEYVVSSTTGDSVSMGDLGARFSSEEVGKLYASGSNLDLAVKSEGFFLLDGQEQRVLTKSGAFMVSEEGFLVSSDGDRVLDIGEAPIVLPTGSEDVVIASDGTISINGQPLAQLAVVDAPQEFLSRVGNTAFSVQDDAYEPVQNAKVQQGALEESNVDPVLEIARMIEVTRAYETSQGIIEDEDDRINSVIRLLGQQS